MIKTNPNVFDFVVKWPRFWISLCTYISQELKAISKRQATARASTSKNLLSTNRAWFVILIWRTIAPGKLWTRTSFDHRQQLYYTQNSTPSCGSLSNSGRVRCGVMYGDVLFHVSWLHVVCGFKILWFQFVRSIDKLLDQYHGTSSTLCQMKTL